jgi:hypothetical protein
MDYQGGSDPNAKTVRLRDRLQEADVERRKAAEEALNRERAAEIRREERLKKINYMKDMPDETPAGTGKAYSKTPLTISSSRNVLRIFWMAQVTHHFDVS